MVGPAKIDHVRTNEKDFIVLVSIVISYEAANVKKSVIFALTWLIFAGSVTNVFFVYKLLFSNQL